jgi:phospholipase/lecithinase/hemolysin
MNTPVNVPAPVFSGGDTDAVSRRSRSANVAAVSGVNEDNKAVGLPVRNDLVFNQAGVCGESDHYQVRKGRCRYRPIQLLVLLALVSLSFAPCASAQAINRIFFFGDSLSDPGNHFIFTHASSRQPFLLGPPEASYDIGGHHFSDGATWAEKLATQLHSPNSGSPALRVPGVFTDYAVGRARARAGATEFPYFDLTTQVQQYLKDFAGQQARPMDLFVIWIGGNDVDDALNALSTDPSGATSAGILQAAVTAVITNVQKLYFGVGARMFLIVNVPDFAKTPYVQFLGANVNPQIPALATLVTGFYDGALSQVVAGLNAGLPLQQNQFIRLLDVNALFSQILVSPDDFGLSNVTNRCTVPGVIGNAICSTPHEYLFWDGIHPTTTVHSAVAQRALEVLPPQ